MIVKKKDYLWLHVRDLPYFRGLLRAVEARFYMDVDLPEPCLDLGCGDGHFAKIAFDRPLEVGLDPWWGPIKEAAERGAYQAVVQALGDQMPFPNRYFASAVSNSVLEHIPQVDEVLKETQRVLKSGAQFLFCVPNHRFLPQLSIAKAFDRIRLSWLAESYRSFFNRISRHHHCDPPDVWEERLNRAGFKILTWWHYFSPQALRTLEWGHYFGLPAWIARMLTGRWILVPKKWNLGMTQKVVYKHYQQEPRREDGVYTFYIAQKSG